MIPLPPAGRTRSAGLAPFGAHAACALFVLLVLACASPAVAADPATATIAGAAAAPLAPAHDWPSIEQVDAPAISSVSPELLDRTGFPERAGVAWNELVHEGVNDRALTFGVTPLALADAARDAGGLGLLDGPAARQLARAAVRVTLGGPLQVIDPHKVANAGRLTSHVTSELKLRVFDVPAPEHAYALGLALVADNLATGYGLDRYGATLIAERRAPCAWTANAGYRIEERYHARVRYEEARLGTGATWRLFSRALGGRGADIGLGAACLLRNQERPPVWQGAARADLPLAPGLDLALSVRASRRHEMPGEDELREAISLAWGLGETAR